MSETQTKTIGFRQAKATPEDFDTCAVLFGILNDIDSGQYPRDVDGQFKETDPEYFDIDDEQHCRVVIRRILRLMARRPSGLNRVHAMAHCADYNEVFDPALDHLAWHPDLMEAVEQRQRRRIVEWAKAHVPELQQIQWRRRDGAAPNYEFSGYSPGHYMTGSPDHGWVLRYKEGGGDITYPEKPPRQGMEPLRLYWGSPPQAGWFWVDFNREVPRA